VVNGIRVPFILTKQRETSSRLRQAQVTNYHVNVDVPVGQVGAQFATMRQKKTLHSTEIAMPKHLRTAALDWTVLSDIGVRLWSVRDKVTWKMRDDYCLLEPTDVFVDDN
jgi:hypothetical protein